MTLFYFTTTGNSLEVAKYLGGRLFSIPSVLNSDSLSFDDNESIGIIFPCHFASIPMPVRLFLRKAILKTPYLFAVVTYGENCADICKICDEFGQKWGKHFHLITSIRMLDNYVVYWDMDAQRKNLPQKKVPQQLACLAEQIAQRKSDIRPTGWLAFLVVFFMRLAPEFACSPHRRHRIEAEKCTGCGVCMQVCPMGNISICNGLPAIQTLCIECGACTHHCPQNAIRWKGERSKARYRNSSVSLSEIIHSSRRF